MLSVEACSVGRWTGERKQISPSANRSRKPDIMPDHDGRSGEEISAEVWPHPRIGPDVQQVTKKLDERLFHIEGRLTRLINPKDSMMVLRRL